MLKTFLMKRLQTLKFSNYKDLNLLNYFVILIYFQVIEFVASRYLSFKRGSNADCNSDFIVLVTSLQATHFLFFTFYRLAFSAIFSTDVCLYKSALAFAQTLFINLINLN